MLSFKLRFLHQRLSTNKEPFLHWCVWKGTLVCCIRSGEDLEFGSRVRSAEYCSGLSIVYFKLKVFPGRCPAMPRPVSVLQGERNKPVVLYQWSFQQGWAGIPPSNLCLRWTWIAPFPPWTSGHGEGTWNSLDIAVGIISFLILASWDCTSLL